MLEADSELDHDLIYSSSSLHKHAWASTPWARHLGNLAERSSSGLVPLLVALPLCVSIFGHIYFRMFSTLHIFLALVWVGLPVAAMSTLVAIASRYQSTGSNRRDTLKAAILLSLTCFVFWRTFTTSPHRGLSDFHYEPSSNQTVFIAIDLYNSEELFPSFSVSLLQLAHHIGEENVYVSIYESNSQDHTKQRLILLEREFERLGIQHRIRMIDNPLREHPDRIHRLAMIRNQALNPIQDGIHGLHGRNFSKLIWLNDIVFRPESVLELLTTNQGNFDQACALDYVPLGFYDTWVMRDLDGIRPTPLWPYFKREEDVNSLRNGDLIPVKSCWNGMTVFDAKWFLPNTDKDANSTEKSGVDDGPIRFRTHPECNISECLLPSYDIHVRSKRRPLIFVNPRAVATYQYRDYLMYDVIMRSNVVNLWQRVWQDLISHSLFGFLAELGRSKDECFETLRSGWKTS